MPLTRILLISTIIGQVLHLCHAQQSQALLPRPNGTYAVGLNMTELIDRSHLQPFAPDNEPRQLGISVFYPCNSSSGALPYMPPEIARAEDIVQSTEFNLTGPDLTFERLAIQLANNDAPISKTADGSKWPVLLFSPAEGTTRHFYNTIISHVSSFGYVVISFDSPYDTDVFENLNGTILPMNTSIQETEPNAVTEVNARAQDATFLLNTFNNATYAAGIIPGCQSCLNVSHVGMFGHSIGGAAAATAIVNESRIAGGLNYDGALWGPVIQEGFSQPFMLMAAAGQTRASENQPNNPDSSWFAAWPKFQGPKFDVILANSLHYTYSDLPIIFKTLNLELNSSVMQAEQITTLDGARALNIVTSYTLAFFDYVLGAKSSALLNGSSPMFPEITFDNTTQVSGSSLTTSASSSSSTTSGKSTSGVEGRGRDACNFGAALLAAGIMFVLL